MIQELSEAPSGLLHAREGFLIQGAVFEVYRAMGSGFLEAVYQECLALEFVERGVPFAASAPLKLDYKGRQLRQGYAADFVCFDKIIVE
jgi:GxxExxY protein